MSIRRTIQVIDTHAVGESGRVIIDQHLSVKGATMGEKLTYAAEHLEGLRRLVLSEPRGFPSLCAPLITAPVNDGSDFGLIVMEQGGFRPMSGSNLICSVTALVETQQVAVTEPVTHLRVDTAAGVVAVQAHVTDGQLTGVTFENVPAFVEELDREFELPGYGTIRADIAFGGQYYVQAKASDFGLNLVKEEAHEIIRAASALCAAAREQVSVQHPTAPEINDIGLPMLYRPAQNGEPARNAVVLPNGTLRLSEPASWTGTFDRSPCGTGTSARMACMHARGELAVGEDFVHRSMLNTEFVGRILGETTEGGKPAVRLQITGRGWITGFNTLVVDPTDPFQEGFTIGGIWGTD